MLDGLSDIGLARRFGETRERHARRLSALTPSFALLTRAHLRSSLGRPADTTGTGIEGLIRTVRSELKANTPLLRRLGGVLNPVGWLFTR